MDTPALPTPGSAPAHLLALRGRLLHRRQVLCAELDAQAQRHSHELQRVQAALNRMDWGLYGDCAECGEPMALQRLLAEPAAVYCTGCADTLEPRDR